MKAGVAEINSFTPLSSLRDGCRFGPRVEMITEDVQTDLHTVLPLSIRFDGCVRGLQAAGGAAEKNTKPWLGCKTKTKVSQ